MKLGKPLGEKLEESVLNRLKYHYYTIDHPYEQQIEDMWNLLVEPRIHRPLLINLEGQLINPLLEEIKDNG